MANLLYLVHRLPYPPNKGDKVRSYHLLKHLAARHQVFLGTFVDDPQDEVHVPTVRALCAELHVARLHSRQAKLRSALALLGSQALTLRYYRDAGMAQWVDQLVSRHVIDAVVVFSSAMAQYAQRLPQLPMLVDFVDVDSAKWSEYAGNHRWPMSWLYGREGKCLLAYERLVAMQATRSFFVTEKESALFGQLAPECAAKVDTISNGVDAEFFSPDPDRRSPFQSAPASAGAEAPEIPIVFTGAMDYWPNIDAVTWFVSDIWPTLRRRWPQLRFYIVGRSPPASVQALADSSVVVTGTVPDVRPYLQHASVVVAPLRVARGIQNKILEAMAMARPVVAARCCVAAIDALDGRELIGAESVSDYVDAVTRLLETPREANLIGAAGRQRVLTSYSWHAHLSRIDRFLPVVAPAAATEA
ncbi:TIGR03087 family PEP-CTERM/XrtA system glycosyltransferase [Rhodoferax sp.]|uniref:TIGR03087 family PEP-CTERM/XrtA system glycosyltransferase n=1 Tax=Rhodoferax sp. TaxID=50421 RepID=UPI00276AB788|nr:TIGR03087 family PEP-CTERM/XrtA system glycosyltransferase [Rhodoferax sp.]